MKQRTLSILLALLPLLASAEPVEIDGIWYNLVKKAKTAEVTRNPSLSFYQDSYSGHITIPETVTYDNVEYKVSTIGKQAFYSCKGLTSVTIPNSITSIGETAFYECGITSVIIPNSVTSIGGYAFSDCKSLSSVSISNNVTTLYGTFCHCSSLAAVTIPNSVTSIDSGAFGGCSSLTSITIPNNVTFISNASFEGCTKLNSIIIPNSVTYIGPYVFEGCSSLTSVIIPNRVTAIDSQAFQNCISLTTVSIPNSVTSIGGYAFENCSSLTTLTIGNGVKKINDNAFARCIELTDVYCMVEELSSTNNWGNGPLYTYSTAFEDSYIEHATLHIPESAINLYKTIEPWSSFGQFKSLSAEEMPKCASPTISFEGGKLKFSCETEGVEFVSEVSSGDAGNKYTAEVNITGKITVKVYATKSGCVNSDTATAVIEVPRELKGDLNNDGTVNVADHVELTKIIMNEE